MIQVDINLTSTFTQQSPQSFYCVENTNDTTKRNMDETGSSTPSVSGHQAAVRKYCSRYGVPATDWEQSERQPSVHIFKALEGIAFHTS